MQHTATKKDLNKAAQHNATLNHTLTIHCNTLQHTATHCNYARPEKVVAPRIAIVGVFESFKQHASSL